jgi:hypothetical protein
MSRGDDLPHRVRDLHDSAMQRLFGAGLVLQSTLAGIADPAVRERIRHATTVLDEIIDEIRSVLHTGMERGPGAGRSASDSGNDGGDAGPLALPPEMPEPEDDAHARMDGGPTRTDRDRSAAVRRATGRRARPW